MSANTDLYDGIYNDVLELTKRPDLAEESLIAVRTATLSLHGRQAWPRDVATSLVKLPNASYLTALDAQVLLPRLKGLSTVRVCDVNFAPMESPHVEIVEMGDIYDPVYGTLKNDIAYIAGTTVNLRTSVAASGYLIEYFQVPRANRNEYNSWIAELAPDVIVYQAAAIVFTTNGNEEKASGYQRMVDKMLFPELVSNFLTSAQR